MNAQRFGDIWSSLRLLIFILNICYRLYRGHRCSCRQREHHCYLPPSFQPQWERVRNSRNWVKFYRYEIPIAFGSWPRCDRAKITGNEDQLHIIRNNFRRNTFGVGMVGVRSVHDVKKGDKNCLKGVKRSELLENESGSFCGNFKADFITIFDCKARDLFVSVETDSI